MQKVGIVDLGSNTARLVVYDYEPGKWFQLSDEIREPVRLGEGLIRHGHLTPEALERALAALRLFSEYSLATGLSEPLDVLATSAVRDATDGGRELLRKTRSWNLDLRILSGSEEAELGVIAVANTFTLEDAWVMDLGGGSAQISQMRQRRFLGGKAYPLGGLRLRERFFENDPPVPAEIARLEAAVAGELGELAGAMRRKPMPLIAMGGSVRNLARAVQKASDYPLQRLHNYFLRRDDLEQLTEELLRLSAAERARRPGIHLDRADFIVASALVYRWILSHAGLDGVYISGYGVREGAFFRRFLPAPPHLLGDVRKFSLRNLFRLYEQPRKHTRAVRRLASGLFEGLMGIHRMGARDAELLDAAAWLHDIGMALGYYNHHKHGAYLIETTHLLNGFSHREQILLMLLVRYHRKGTPRLDRWRRLLDDERDLVRLRRLAVCLRLAEHLERSRTGRRVRGIETAVHDDRVELAIVAEEEPTVEIWEAKKQAAVFKLAFGRDLVLTSVLEPRSSPVASP